MQPPASTPPLTSLKRVPNLKKKHWVKQAAYLIYKQRGLGEVTCFSQMFAMTLIISLLYKTLIKCIIPNVRVFSFPPHPLLFYESLRAQYTWDAQYFTDPESPNKGLPGFHHGESSKPTSYYRGVQKGG